MAVKGIHYISSGAVLNTDGSFDLSPEIPSLKKNTMSFRILSQHHIGKSYCLSESMLLKMDALVSPDNVYATIIQTARASGVDEFKIPFVLTNCHNCLCSIGGTINEDDHAFGYTSARKYGGVFVPPYMGVIHQFMREQYASSGAMIMGSDSHTRYGALGTLGIGEGGGELVKQLLEQPYVLKTPAVVAVILKGKLEHGVGPHDVAIAMAGALFPDGLVRNKILEFVGEGVSTLSMDYRLNIDAMTTECAALSSVWVSDEKTKDFYEKHGRVQWFKEMKPVYPAYYDSVVEINLSEIRPMIALPFHPSNCYTIEYFKDNAEEILKSVEDKARTTMPGFSFSSQYYDGEMHFTQGTSAGCVGGLYENLCSIGSILRDSEGIKPGLSLHVYPASQPIWHRLTETGVSAELSQKGVVVMPSYCGPCFGVQDIPSNSRTAMRHITRNFLNREGSRPAESQSAGVALMDSRSIAATLRNGGILTSASEIEYDEAVPEYEFDRKIYAIGVYSGFGKPFRDEQLVKGPNITDWPKFRPLPENYLLKVSGVYTGSVTTDDLVPSGEASAYRSNPEKLATVTLQNKDSGYYERNIAVRNFAEGETRDFEFESILHDCADFLGCKETDIGIGSVLCAEKIGDGSAREQAASSQRVLGGCADIATEYSTKRFRSNLINWGMLPLVCNDVRGFKVGQYILIRGIRESISSLSEEIDAYIVSNDGKSFERLVLTCPGLSEEEGKLLIAGCLINSNRQIKRAK